jgi:hypothetical protein
MCPVILACLVSRCLAVEVAPAVVKMISKTLNC